MTAVLYFHVIIQQLETLHKELVGMASSAAIKARASDASALRLEVLTGI